MEDVSNLDETLFRRQIFPVAHRVGEPDDAERQQITRKSQGKKRKRNHRSTALWARSACSDSKQSCDPSFVRTFDFQLCAMMLRWERTASLKVAVSRPLFNSLYLWDRVVIGQV